METQNYILPKVVSRDEWLLQRKELLKTEKELTHQIAAVNEGRRRLPMVKIEKEYTFEGPDGSVTLQELFNGHQQLIIYHFMYEPDGTAGCPGCSFIVDHIGNMSHIHARDTDLILISRAPLEKLEAYKERMGWSVPWYSSYGNDFNYDFHVTIDEDKGSTEYNYQPVSELGENWKGWKGEQPGLSVFLRENGDVYHSYSIFGRGLEILDGTLMYLDLTPLGRQEFWEKPEGRANSKAGAWWHRHDEY